MHQKAKYVNHNGKLRSADKPLLYADNRSFRYGDGLFETVRIYNERMPLWPLHYQRLRKGMTVLGSQAPAEWTEEALREQLLKTARKNKMEDNARLRITVWRERGGSYLPRSQRGHFLIECEKHHQEGFALNKKGLQIDLYPFMEKTTTVVDNLKTTSALIYVMAARYARENNVDDCLILNYHTRLCDGVSSNIFLIKDEKIQTPPLSEGCVDGVMRRYLIDIFKKEGIPFEEEPLNVEVPFMAEELFLTNAVRGIRWVSGFKAKRYSHTFTAEISAILEAYLSGRRNGLKSQ